MGRTAYLLIWFCITTAATTAATAAAGVPAQAVPAPPTRDTTVLSFNIRYGRADDGPDSWPHRRELVCETIRAHAPAVFGVQECLVEQAAVLREAFPAYTFTGYGRDDGAEAGEMCALFVDRARYDVLDAGVFWLSETPAVVGSRGWDAALHRIATWVQLRDRVAAPETLFVFNAHFDHVGEEARRHSAALLRERVGAIAGPHAAIVLGDFNAPADGPVRAALAPADGRLADTFTCAGRDERRPGEGTFHGFKGEAGPARIDWILATPELPCRDAGIDRSSRDGRFPSDHFPVWAVFRQAVRP
ncbi:endonuclease/exonuclease/phosphatase family protein [bacterium]|nr:endonuclease/exonuclease/phosphatase family protein [bacterium]